MSNVCISCNSSDTSIRKFLLRCAQCSTLWHHRCHKPPVSDPELVAVIARFNEEKRSGKANPTFVWRCGSCLGSDNKPQSALPKRDVHQDSMPLASGSKPTVSRPPEKQRSIAIDAVLQNPPMQVSSTKQVKGAQISSKSTRAFLVPLDPKSVSISGSDSNIQGPSAAPPTITRKSTTPKPQTSSKSAVTVSTSNRTLSATTVTTRPSGIRIIDDPFIERRPRASVSASPTPTPSESTPRPSLRPHASSSSSSSALIPGLLDLHMSTDKDTNRDRTMRAISQELERNDRGSTLEYVTPPPPRLPSAQEQGGKYRKDTLEYVTPPPPRRLPSTQRQDRNDREDTLEYVTPPPPPSFARARTGSTGPPPVPLSRVGRPHVAHSLPPIAVISEAPPDRPHLLSSAWIRNIHGTSSDAEPDIWQRATLRRLKIAGASASTGRSLTSPLSGKFKARKLNESVGRAEKNPSQTPFFFSADMWLKAKKDTLPSYPTQ